MKIAKLSLLALSMGSLVACQQGPKNVDAKVAKDPVKKSSYAIGLAMAQDIKRNVASVAGQDKDLDTALIYATISDYLNSGKAHLDSAALQTALMDWQKGMMDKKNKDNEAAAAENEKKGAQYIAEQMKANPKLQKTASGLVYEVITEGSGAKPTGSQMVSVNYKGTLIDGTTFDESKGQPVEFPLNQVIKGWTEGLQLMSPGAKYKFIIPAALAYGPQERPPFIKPGSTLVFEVELLKVK